MSVRSVEEMVKSDIGYPEDDDLQKFVTNRNRMGRIWITVFMTALVVAIVALSALLYNVVRDAFGYVVIQNTVDPAQLMLEVEEARMLTAANTVASEDDNDLVAGITEDPYAIGYFGYTYYLDNDDKLQAVTVNGIDLNAETVAAGSYPYARPLFIYSAPEVMAEKPYVAGYINFYLNNLDTVIEETGFLPADPLAVEAARQTWLDANDITGEFPTINPASVVPPEGESLSVIGSSTVYPLSRKMAIAYRQAGYNGGLQIEQVGTSAGFEQFCARNGIDVADASRAINRAEMEACDKAKRTPTEFNVATDALVIAVSQKNDFLQDVSTAQLREIFTDYENWSDVDPSYPDAPIMRYIPGQDSGTLDFFAENTFARSPQDLSHAELDALLQFHLSAGRYRALDAEQPIAERSQEDLLDLVYVEIVEPRVVKSYNLIDSIFNKDEVYAYAETLPNAYVDFYNWVSFDFLVTPQSSIPEYAGIRTAILGSLWVIAITIFVAVPLGIAAAIYLEEYAAEVANPTLRRINGIIQTNINNLAGVPSIIYGMLGLAVFVRALEPLTSGTAFGAADPATANGRTIVSAGMTLALLILPIIIINSQEAIRAVPRALRQASMGLGATKWQTIWHHVLPNALPGILTGVILAVSRAIGETAPLLVVGVSTFIVVDPTGPFSKFTTLPAQIYQWTSRPQAEFQNIAAAAIIVLLVLLLTLNATAVFLRNRYSKQLS